MRGRRDQGSFDLVTTFASGSRREADLFLDELLGGSAPRAPAGGREEAYDQREPFFGDTRKETWRVLARGGTLMTSIQIRDDDVVVRRARRGTGWRLKPAADLDTGLLLDEDLRLRSGVLILRRGRTRFGFRREPAQEQEEQEEEAPTAARACPAPPGSACAYFFKGGSYLRYNIATDAVDVGPASIGQFWRLPDEFQSNIDAAVNWGDGRAFFFKGARCLTYNIATNRVDVGPRAISEVWPHLPAEFQSNLGAAVNWGDGHAYFFKGAGYLRYNIATDLVDVGPVAISRFWTHLPAEFQSNLDAVVNWGDGHAYFFKGEGYLRYDIATDLVDVGPVAISRFWPSVPATFRSGIKAAVNWTHPADLAAFLRRAGLNVNEIDGWRRRRSTGEGGCFTPIGVIIHHTVGLMPGVLGDIRDNVKANLFIDRAGQVNVISDGRANHAGDGAPLVLDETSRGIAPSGTAAARGLRQARMGNGYFYGLENENLGDGRQPWPEVQLDAMARASAALCQRHGWSANRVISHAEWSSNKIDPAGIDMNVFRARVAALF